MMEVGEDIPAEENELLYSTLLGSDDGGGGGGGDGGDGRKVD